MDDQQSTPPAYLDDNGNAAPPPEAPAQKLQSAVNYGVQQDPVKYAKLLQLQQLTGVPPAVSNGNEDQVNHAAQVGKLDPRALTTMAPRTSTWATNPDNAAVSGVDEIHRVAGIEQNAVGMRAVQPTERTSGGFWGDIKDTFLDAITHPLETLVGADTPKAAAQKQAGVAQVAEDTNSPFLKSEVKQQQQMASPLINVSGTKPFQNILDPKSRNVLSRTLTGGTKALEALSAPDNLGLLVSMPLAPADASALISGVFSAQMGEGAAAGGYETLRAAYHGDYGDAAEKGAQALVGAAFAVASAKHGLTERVSAELAPAPTENTSPFLDHLSEAVTSASDSPLRERSPEKFNEAMEAVFAGDSSLRIPADKFGEYFKAQGEDPAAVATSIGSNNYAEAVLSGGDVEVPKAGYLGKLDPDHQKALLPDVVDPATGLSANQHQEGREQLEQWAAGGGPEQLQAETAQADTETAASPEFQQVHEELRQRYIAAGETPEVADTLATKDANVYSNIAKSANLKPSELLAMYNPRVTVGEAPEGVTPIQFKDTTEAKLAIAGHDGKETTLLTSARELPARYRLVEADTLVPSHNASTFAKNPAYPEGLQERAYDTSKEAQARVIQQAQNYDSRYTVNTNPDAVNGPPVVTPDGTVLGGNSRAMSTQRLYEKDGSAYKDALKEQAATYGFTPEQVDSMAKPVLVRQVESPATADDARRLGSELNKSMTGAMGVSERAVSAGKNIKPDTLRNVANMLQSDDSTLREAMAKHGSEIVKMLTGDGVITERERPQFVDAATGGLSEEGKTFVERALMGSVIDDPRLMDSAPKSVLNKLERSLGSITSFASRPDEWNLLPAIREAVGELGAIQRSDSTVDLHLGQTSMFGGDRNPLVDAMIRALDGKPNAVRDAFDSFAKDADANLPGQSRMFGEASAFDSFNHAFGSKLSEQEYHDGLEAAAAKEPDTSAGQNSQGNESVSGVLHQNATPSSGGSEGLGRGWFRVLPDGSYEIGRTKIGDFSTFAHESAHAYLHVISDLATREGASEVLQRDHAKILDFLGAKPGEELTTEQQEKWARANEQYLREGKAPSSGLRGTFQRFGVWLQSVYKKASDLGVNLSDDIRGVLDRLYAAESGVDRAAREAGSQMFTSADEAGWTEEQFKTYADAHEVSVEQAKEHILGKLNEARLREGEQSWREEESNTREAVTAEIDQRPEYKAIRALRKGKLEDGTELTMSKDELVKQFGEDRVKELQKSHPGMYRTEGGVEPETAAEMLGFNSANEMLTAMEQAPRRSAAIEQGTRDFMTAKHGDIRYDGTLQDQARLAVENDKRADGLHRELTALKKKLAEVKSAAADKRQSLRDITVAPIAAYREAAAQMVESKAVADLQPTRYLDASRKYAREAFDALRRGDAEEAATAKHKELMNHFLFRSATEAKEYVGKFEKYVQRVTGGAAQKKLGLAGSDYRDQFNGILARYGLAPYQGQPARTLSDWTLAQFNDGKEPAIDPLILNEARVMNFRNTPVAEVRMVHDALVNVRKLASLELGMTVSGRKIQFDSAVESMVQSARANLKDSPHPVFEENRQLGQKAADLVNRGSALLDRTEFLMKRLDGGVEGPWHDYLWHLAADAQGKEYELQRDVTGRIGDALENMPKEQRASLLDKVNIEGVSEPLTRKRMIAMAFNMGNEGNLDRLEKTFAAQGWDVAAIDKVKSALTREEWKFVQDGWNSLKPLGQAQAELERRMTGLPPVMVRPEMFHVEHPDGTESDLEGGYYPIVMDPRFSKQGALQDAGMTAQNLMESGYGRATTSRGNMKERTGFGGPLQLDYEQVLTQHTAKVIKDISHREFMLAANKLLIDQDVRSALQDTLGMSSEKQFMPWLRTIINDRNGSTTQGLGFVSEAMNGLRTNVVKAALGFKFSTVLLQLTHASSVFLHTSPGSYAQAMIDFVAHPSDMSQQIRDLSPNEMANRGDNLDRDMREVLRSADQKKTLGGIWARAGMAPVQFMDHVLSFPLWLSVYRDALAKNVDMPESEAKYQAMQKADGAVRMGLGSNAPKDLPPLMRNNDVTKLLTTMGGFHNLKWNQIADQASQFRNGGNTAQLSYGLVMAAIIPAIMGPLITGRGPGDENKALWAAKRALLFPAETIGILNIAVEALENGGDIRFSPIGGMLERQAKAIKHATGDNPDWEGVGLDALQSAMEAYGVSGTDQLFKTLRYGRKIQQGKVENPNPWDAITGGSTAPRK